MTEVFQLKLSASDFKDRLKKLTPFMSTEETRSHLSGVHLVWNGESLKAEATDGHILCDMLIGCESEGKGAFDVIMPRDAVLHLTKVIGKQDDDFFVLTVLDDGKRVRFDFSDFEYVTRTVDGLFPDTAGVIPEGKLRMREGLKADHLIAALKALGEHPVDILVDEAEQAANLPHLLTSSKAKGVRCVVMPMRLAE